MRSIGETAAILDGVVVRGSALSEDPVGLDWANPKLLSFPDEVREQVGAFCMETFNWPKRKSKPVPFMCVVAGLSFNTENNDYFEVTATPVIDLQNRITQVARGRMGCDERQTAAG